MLPEQYCFFFCMSVAGKGRKLKSFKVFFFPFLFLPQALQCKIVCFKATGLEKKNNFHLVFSVIEELVKLLILIELAGVRCI